jgi:hypothetical protein
MPGSFLQEIEFAASQGPLRERVAFDGDAYARNAPSGGHALNRRVELVKL